MLATIVVIFPPSPHHSDIKQAANVGRVLVRLLPADLQPPDICLNSDNARRAFSFVPRFPTITIFHPIAILTVPHTMHTVLLELYTSSLPMQLTTVVHLPSTCYRIGHSFTALCPPQYHSSSTSTRYLPTQLPFLAIAGHVIPRLTDYHTCPPLLLHISDSIRLLDDVKPVSFFPPSSTHSEALERRRLVGKDSVHISPQQLPNLTSKFGRRESSPATVHS